MVVQDGTRMSARYLGGGVIGDVRLPDGEDDSCLLVLLRAGDFDLTGIGDKSSFWAVRADGPTDNPAHKVGRPEMPGPGLPCQETHQDEGRPGEPGQPMGLLKLHVPRRG